ncbi:MAG: hypothetical protein GF392_05355 [Candidatus Omnitrophica bacterium]|nr:hypothetical protein [Candidatus Omnitrophota bacterium]
MKKKKFRQSCSMSSDQKKGNGSSRKSLAGMNSGTRKDMERVYNKFYRDQVAALYRAVRGS